MGHLDSILVDARPLMVSHNFYICEISSWDSTKNPGITLVFSSPGGLRIDMAINIRPDHWRSVFLDSTFKTYQVSNK